MMGEGGLGTMAGKHGKRVLVVEDDEDVAALLAECLEGAGYAALTADGAQGLAAIRANPPDLILLDMLMPGVDGFEFLSRLYDVSGGMRIPVLIVSGLGAMLQAAVESRVASIHPAVGVIPKPFNTDDLMAKVNDVIGRRG